MLIHTMTPKEAKEEWLKDDGQLIPCKLTKWYKNIGKSLKIKTFFPAFYRYETKTKRNNKRYMIIRYDSYSDYIHKRNLRAEYSIIDTPNGCRAYLRNYDSDSFYVYSSHCIKRYSQRFAKDFHGANAVHKMFKDNLDIKNLTPFMYDDSVIVRATHGLFFGRLIEDNIIVFTTFVDNERLFENQIETNEYMSEYSEEYIRNYREYIKKIGNIL